VSEQPVIADTKPVGVDLKKGETYYYCACGKSSSQPFCDGSHAGTSFQPKAFVASETTKAFLCQCKHTGTAPYCDGSHAKLDLEQETAQEEKVQQPAASRIAQPTKEEPTVTFIQELAEYGLSQTGHHGRMDAMGVPRKDLPHWDDIQIMVAQMATKPLLDDVEIATNLVIGPNAKKPLTLDIPLFVSDMSFGALSEEAKTAMAKGAELAFAPLGYRAKPAIQDLLPMRTVTRTHIL